LNRNFFKGLQFTLSGKMAKKDDFQRVHRKIFVNGWAPEGWLDLLRPLHADCEVTVKNPKRCGYFLSSKIVIVQGNYRKGFNSLNLWDHTP
jgi:hypothetical protein